MHAVALTQLASEADAEAPALALDLGVTPYDARLLLLSGLPVVVHAAADEGAVLELAARLRARGHGAVVFDLEAVVPSQAMVTPHRFRLEGHALELLGPRPATLPFEDISALIAAEHRAETRTTTHRQVVNPFAAAGPLPALLFTNVEEMETSEEAEAVLYVFRRSGETPWLLREHGTNWSGLVDLGQSLEPAERGNFRMLVRAMRERAPRAAYDEALSHPPAGGQKVTFPGPAHVRSSSAAHVDVQAHVLARWLVQPS